MDLFGAFIESGQMGFQPIDAVFEGGALGGEGGEEFFVVGDELSSLILGALVILQLIYHGLVRVIAFRAPPWSSVTYPLGGIITGAILLEGMIRVASGAEIKWKGRDLLGRPDLPLKW